MDYEGLTVIGREIFKKRASKSDVFKVDLNQRAKAHADNLQKDVDSLQQIISTSQNQPSAVLRQGLANSDSFAARRVLELDNKAQPKEEQQSVSR